MTQNNNTEIHDNDIEVKDRESTVGMSKSSRKLILAAIVLLTIVALFYIFSSNSTHDSKSKNQESVSDTLKASVPVVADDKPILDLPTQLPELPTLVAPPAPPSLPKKEQVPIPTVPELPTQSLPILNQGQVNYPYIDQPSVIENKRSRVIQDRNTPMLIMSGSGNVQGSSSGNIDLSDPTNIVSVGNLDKIKNALKKEDKSINEESPLERTSSAQVKATYIGDLNVIVAQGKLIEAVLETSINTDLKGMLRAIISRDVYSESGTNVLLPKGSRLIGEYDSAIADSQVRVDIIWNRVMRPDGIDVQIQSPGTDQLGKAGIAGEVDTKFGHLFMNSFLISSVKIAGGAVLNKLLGNDAIKTETQGDKTTETASPAAILSTDAINNLTKVFETIVKRYENNKPTIRIDQGTRMKVYVNKDIVFSNNLNNRLKVVN